jgi:hypothetical protein
MEELTVSMVETIVSPEKIEDGVVIKAVKETYPVLSVTKTTETTETYNLAQINDKIATIEKELANVQVRLDYQFELRDALTQVK